MAIFSRRTIQRLINENNSIFKMPVKEQIKVLNVKSESFNNEFLAREWEIVVLNAFAHTFKNFGEIIHEKKFNQKPLDIYFESAENPKLNFVADICSITDYGTDERFPIENLERRYYELINKRNLYLNSFNIKVGDNSNLISRETGGVVLYLPNEEDFDKKVFNEKFDVFLDTVEQNPTASHRLIINETEFVLPAKRINSLQNQIIIWFFRTFYKTSFFKKLLRNKKFYKIFDEFVKYTWILMSYEPNQRFSFKIANSHKDITLLENNTLFYRLKDKHKQLSKSKASFAKGIIICDGNYEPFSSIYSAATQWTSKSYDAKEVINHFLKKSDFLEVNFVIFFGIYPYGETHKVVSKCFIRPGERQIDDSILKIIKSDDLIKNFPKPQRTVENAVNRLKSEYKNLGSKLGMIVMEDNKIKISSREVLELLSGRTSVEDFADNSSHPILGNPFEAKLKQGRLIISVDVEHPEDEQDDEYIVFNFGEPDVAISNFKNPQIPKKK